MPSSFQTREVTARDGKIFLAEVDPDYGKATPLYEDGVENIDVPEGATEVKSGNVTFIITDHITSVSQITFDKTEMSMGKGETKSINAKIAPDNATNKTIVWTSNNNNVAKVDQDGNVTAVEAGEALITATTEDGAHTAECRVTVTIPVTGVTLNKTSATLNIGKKVGLTATVQPKTATNKNISWSSDDESVATVDKNGKVTAVGLGETKIWVTTEEGDKTEYCTVTVNPIEVANVKLNKTELTLTEGDHEKLVATVTPDNATDRSVTWKSSDTSVARVDDDGTVTAVSPGTAKITVVTVDRGLKTSCAVTVNVRPVDVEGVYLEDTDVRLTEGESAQLVANIYPGDATDKGMTWKSSNTAVATVDSKGKVKAVKEGTAIVTVTTNDGGYKDSSKVTVEPKVIEASRITLDKKQLVLDKGKTGKLTATVTPDNAVDKSVAWSSSNTGVATVDNTGNVTAVNHGTAKITAKTSNGKTAECEVQVNADSFTGVKKDGGQLKRFRSGAVDTAYTGLDKYPEDGKWYYFAKGIHDPSFTGVAQRPDGKWLYVKNGVFDNTFTGVAKNTDNKWVFVKKGVFNTSFTGVARNTSGNWVFVKKGRYYAKYTGVAKSTSGNRVYVIKGKFSNKAKKSTGVAKSTSGKYVFVRKGRFDSSYTGLTKSLKTGKIVYVTKGYMNTKYNGKAKYKGQVYTVKKGMAVMN